MVTSPAPKPEDQNVVAGFDSADILKRMDNVEGEIEKAQKQITDVQNQNRFIIIVLFVGFLALLFVVIFYSIGAVSSYSSNFNDLNKSVKELNSKVK